MRILLLNYEFPPVGGGAGRATYNIARELVRLGHNVDVLTSRMKGHKRHEVIDNIMIYRVLTHRKNIHDCGFFGAFIYIFLAYFKLLKLVHSTRYDILHYFFSLPTGLLTVLPGKHRKIPYIISLRGSDVPFYDPYNVPLKIAHSLLKSLTIRIWRQARYVVALSNSLRDLAHKTNPAQPIEVIRNGIDADLFHPGDVPRNSKTFKLLTVSRLLERKGIQYLLKALSQLSNIDVSLTIVGMGNFEVQLKKLCVKYGLNGMVRFFGYCPNEKLSSIYQDHDVFVLPSLAESFGIVFLEAMACGLPVIGGFTGGIPSIISQENGILVEPREVNEIKKSILVMKDQPAVRKEMEGNNRKKVLEQYSWLKVAEMYQNIYRGKAPGKA